jgi:hypothetical protein
MLNIKYFKTIVKYMTHNDKATLAKYGGQNT